MGISAILLITFEMIIFVQCMFRLSQNNCKFKFRNALLVLLTYKHYICQFPHNLYQVCSPLRFINTPKKSNQKIALYKTNYILLLLFPDQFLPLFCVES